MDILGLPGPVAEQPGFDAATGGPTAAGLLRMHGEGGARHHRAGLFDLAPGTTAGHVQQIAVVRPAEARTRRCKPIQLLSLDVSGDAGLAAADAVLVGPLRVALDADNDVLDLPVETALAANQATLRSQLLGSERGDVIADAGSRREHRRINEIVLLERRAAGAIAAVDTEIDAGPAPCRGRWIDRRRSDRRCVPESVVQTNAGDVVGDVSARRTHDIEADAGDGSPDDVAGRALAVEVEVQILDLAAPIAPQPRLDAATQRPAAQHIVHGDFAFRVIDLAHCR